MNKSTPGLAWLFTMAWRDSRRNWTRLILFVSSIILGIAALVAINSFGDNLRNDIENEAKALLGADLLISGRQAPSKEIQIILDSLQSLSKNQAREASFASMVNFGREKGARLANVRALSGPFPFYGELETDPLGVGEVYAKEQSAVVDRSLLLQFDSKAGDKIKVGKLSFKIAGGLLKAPGQNNIASTVAPKIYIPMRFLNETDLIKRGSRVTYRYYYLLKEEVDADALVEILKERLRKEDYGWATVASRKESLGDAFSLLTSFLNLVAFVALLLGCVGVASAVQIYTREKLPSVAVLRCLGASGRMAFQIYLIQVFMMGLLGSVLGAALGSMIQVLIPQVLKDFLPLEVSYSVSWLAVGQGIITGVAIAILFALVPLLGIRRISPLRTLRASYEESGSYRDPLSWLVYLLIFGFVYGFSFLQIGDFWNAFYFSAFLLFSFFLLAGVAQTLMWLVRKYFPVSWSYVWRQGLANLFRPNNQTLILILTIGLGTALISTLYFVQDLLLRQVSISDRNNQPNMVLFDIQTDQRAAVAKFTKESDFPIIQELPIVAMRLAEYNGRTRSELNEDSVDRLPRDVINREYRVSYRDTLDINEKLVKGKLGSPVTSPQDSIFVSISDNHARRMKAKIGDEVIFNVQGALVKTYIGSIRKLDLTQFRTSFTFVFPTGVLENAPQFHVLITRTPNEEASAKFQSQIIEDYPNVSVVDISLVLKTAEEVLDEVSFVIRFMALFSILTGIIVLIGSVIISRYQRIRESVLLRTLGASRRQILNISLLEYYFLGSLASLSGIGLSLIASWALSVYTFEVDFNPNLWPILYIYLIINVLCVGIGLSNHRGLLSRPPLEVLRKEVY